LDEGRRAMGRERMDEGSLPGGAYKRITTLPVLPASKAS
jgi:hypothetical protein